MMYALVDLVTSRNGHCHRFLFDFDVIILTEWVPLGQTVKQQYYIEVLRKLRFLVDIHITVLEHLLYSPDLTPYDFYLFLKGKNALMGTHFQSVEEVNQKNGRLAEDGDT
ncbi:hypothetical protein TNCV_4644381 [Trichonephila clavipes]|nr:hypothetical protein TNCV_4644381 [Trichonephila clavipes]